MNGERCFYCCKTYPPATPSREHVLADAFGSDLKLPPGAVCRECNQTLNLKVDQPFQAVFSLYLNFFSIGSSKREASAPVRVLAETREGGIVPVRLPRKGRAYTPRRQLLSRQGDGHTRTESWNFTSWREIDEYLRSLRSAGVAFQAKVRRATITPRFHHANEANVTLLGQGVAKACFNYVIFRLREIARASSFDVVRDLVLHGKGQWPVGIPEVLGRGEAVNVNAAKPVHRVRVVSDGQGLFEGTLVLFGLLPFVIRFSGAWPRKEIVTLEHEFDGRGRTHRTIT